MDKYTLLAWGIIAILGMAIVYILSGNMAILDILIMLFG